MALCFLEESFAKEPFFMSNSKIGKARQSCTDQALGLLEDRAKETLSCAYWQGRTRMRTAGCKQDSSRWL